MATLPYASIKTAIPAMEASWQSSTKEIKTFALARKVTMTIFWASTKTLSTDYFVKNQTINRTYYAAHLDKVNVAIIQKNPR